jgi:hypothetical protein
VRGIVDPVAVVGADVHDVQAALVQLSADPLACDGRRRFLVQQEDHRAKSGRVAVRYGPPVGQVGDQVALG